MDLGPFPHAWGHARAISLDAADPLAALRHRFVIDDPDLVYLDGNSLGRLPIDAVDAVHEITEREWGIQLIRSWNDGWGELQLEMGDLLAPVIGANPGEVILSDSTSVNLYKLATAAVAAAPERTKIVTDDLNFPSDQYVIAGIASEPSRDLTVEVVPSDGVNGPIAGLRAAIDSQTALVTLSHTTFKSGYTYDMAAMTAMAHEAGALMLWDMSHSAGVVDADLSGCHADLAVGCTYKYLNGGPGAPAFLYVRKDLQEQLEVPITGWWAHADPFAFDLAFSPTAGIRRFHAGTMPILSLGAARPGIEMVADVGMAAIRAKSVSLVGWMEDLFEEHLAPLGFLWASPTARARRGSHVSLTHPHAWQLTQALIQQGAVLPDFRTPDHLRLGMSPLYTSHLEVHTAVVRLASICASGVWESYPTTAGGVT